LNDKPSILKILKENEGFDLSRSHGGTNPLETAQKQENKDMLSFIETLIADNHLQLNS